jgi:hypothetical protein
LEAFFAEMELEKPGETDIQVRYLCYFISGLRRLIFLVYSQSPAGSYNWRNKQIPVYAVIHIIIICCYIITYRGSFAALSFTCCSVRSKGNPVDILLHHMLCNELDGSQNS